MKIFLVKHHNQLTKWVIFTNEEMCGLEIKIFVPISNAISGKDKIWTKLAGMQCSCSSLSLLLPSQEITTLEE